MTTFICALVLLKTPAAAAAAGPEVVIASERLAEVGADLEKNLQAFLRRLEEVGGWPAGTLRGKAFTRPREALAYIKKQHPAFAILPPHELAEGRAMLKPEILGRAVWIDGDHAAVFALTRQPPPFDGIQAAAGMRLATTDAHDRVWLTLMFENGVDARGLKLVEVPSADAAVQAVLDKRAELALVPELEWTSKYEKRTEKGGDLAWAYRSPDLPPLALIAVGKNASPEDKQKMAAGIDKTCKTTGAAACGRMRIQFIEAGRADTYEPLFARYEGWRKWLGR